MPSDDLGLLRRLFAAWRASRAPELEPLIDKAGMQIARARGPIEGSKAELEVRWHETLRGKDLGDVDRLLNASWKIPRIELRARINALATLPPDPRIARGLADLGRTFDAEDTHDLHRLIASLLERTPSARLLPAIDAIEAARSESTTRMIYASARHAISQLETRPAEPSLLERARNELGCDDDLADLFAEHTANPGDIALRTVLADRLQAAGDPRGEFIALQLDGGAAAMRRAKRLLEEHIDAWTGPLPGIDPDRRRFARGFLVAAYVDLHQEQLARSLDRPEWVTLEELSVGVRSTRTTADVALLVARMPLLRRFAGPSWAVEQLAAAGEGKALQAIVTDEWLSDVSAAPYLPAATTTFPALEVLLWGTRSPRAKHLRLAKELGLRAVGQTGASPEEITRTLKAGRGVPLELRFSSCWGRELGLSSGWQMRIDEDRSYAEIQHSGTEASHVDPLLPLLQCLVDAGLPRIVVNAPSPTTRAAANALGVDVEFCDDLFDFLG